MYSLDWRRCWADLRQYMEGVLNLSDIFEKIWRPWIDWDPTNPGQNWGEDGYVVWPQCLSHVASQQNPQNHASNIWSARYYLHNIGSPQDHNRWKLFWKRDVWIFGCRSWGWKWITNQQIRVDFSPKVDFRFECCTRWNLHLLKIFYPLENFWDASERKSQGHLESVLTNMSALTLPLSLSLANFLWFWRGDRR